MGEKLQNIASSSTRDSTPKNQEIEIFKSCLQCKFPFSFSDVSLLGTIFELSWYYIDCFNNMQGPFSSLEMDRWFQKGFITNELIIAYKNTGIDFFFKMKALFRSDLNNANLMVFRKFMKRTLSLPQF